MSTTAGDLIKATMRLIGALPSGETPTGAEFSDALAVLNDMIDGWSNNGLLLPNKVAETFSFVGGQQSYTLGTGGNFNTNRPTRIIDANVLNNNIEIPLKLITVDEWSKIPLKSTTSTIPQLLYDDGNYPVRTLNFWPIPSVTNKVILYSLKTFTNFTSIAQAISLPPGYQKALRYNLAAELALEYGKTIDPLIIQIAGEIKAELMRQNWTPQYMESDAPSVTSGKPFNWLTGE